jgi:ankyrin repeat protein
MEQFIKTLDEGDLSRAKLLYFVHNIDLNQITEEGIKLYHRLIINASDNNFIDILKWILEMDHNIINDRSIMNQAFSEVCYKGYMDIALWLLELNCIDMNFDNNAHFKFACMGGQLEMAKWLFKLDMQLDIHVNSDDAFWSACINGHLDVAKWLYELDGKINISKEKVDHINKYSERDLEGKVGIVALWLKSIYN